MSDDREVSPLTLPISSEVITLIMNEIVKDEPIIRMEEYSKVNNIIPMPKKSDTYDVWSPSVQSLINQYIRGMDSDYTYYRNNNDDNSFDYSRFR